MSKEMIISVNGREKKIAIVEDDVVTEFYVERGDENQGIVGNIYKGRVMKVLPGMQSAFVDIGWNAIHSFTFPIFLTKKKRKRLRRRRSLNARLRNRPARIVMDCALRPRRNRSRKKIRSSNCGW